LHGHFSLANFAGLFDRSLRPLLNTLVFASLAAVCVTLIGVPIGYVVTRFRSGVATVLDVVATLPFAVAGTVLAIGFVVSFNSGPWRTMTVVMFQALEGSGAGIATAAASTLIVVTLLPIVLLYRLVRRYELSMS